MEVHRAPRGMLRPVVAGWLHRLAQQQQPLQHKITQLLQQRVHTQHKRLLQGTSSSKAACWVSSGPPTHVTAGRPKTPHRLAVAAAVATYPPAGARVPCRGFSSFEAAHLLPNSNSSSTNSTWSTAAAAFVPSAAGAAASPIAAAHAAATAAADARHMEASGWDLNSLCSSVVKVYSDFTDPNYALPWQMQRQGSSTGSGFIVHPASGGKERIIITNAHCVAWNNRLHLRKHGSPIKYPARVLAVAHECDLAVLTVDNDEFWADTQGLLFGDIPALQDGVIVLGYPRGGDNLCITSGVVSRVDVNTYAHSNAALLCVQIDAAINPGNSGGPALKEGRVVGVAFQGCEASAAQNVGYIVPWNVVNHLFTDLKRHGKYTGFPAAGVLFQPLENECMQQKLGVTKLKKEDLPPGVTAGGILVTATDAVRSRNFLERARAAADKVEAAAASSGTGIPPEPATDEAAAAKAANAVAAPFDSRPLADPSALVQAAIAAADEATAAAAAAGKPPPSAAERRALLHSSLEQAIGLQQEDVVMAVEGADVAGDGTVHFRGMERVSVSHVISEKFMGETLNLTVLRKGKVQNVVVPLEREQCLIPKHQWGIPARYIVYGGLVFCPLTLEYLKDEFGPKFHERAPSSLLRPLSEVFATVEGEEPIVLTQILASDLTSGYSARNCLLSSVDGTKVINLRHLAQLLGIRTTQQQQPHKQEQPREHEQQKQQEQQQQSEFVTFVLEEKLQVVLNRKKAEAMLPEILKQHAIHSQTSDNL